MTCAPAALPLAEIPAFKLLYLLETLSTAHTLPQRSNLDLVFAGAWLRRSSLSSGSAFFSLTISSIPVAPLDHFVK